MTALLTKNLPLVAGAPDGIKKLRELILELSVRGRLSEHLNSDGMANDLINQIKEKRAARSSGSPLKEIESPTRDRFPYKIPESWTWTTASAISEEIVDCPHSTPKFLTEGFLCLDTNSIKKGSVLLSRARYVDAVTYKERVVRLVPQPGDIVFAREGSVGESMVIPDDMVCCLGQRVMLFRPCLVLPKYFRLALSEPGAKSRALSLNKGIGAKHVNVADMRNALIPLPPLAEQHRIVAKVDELMALCDKLEADQADAEAAHAQLVRALLESLTHAKDAEDFQENWRRLSENFHTLFTTEASIDFLKQSVLQLGVMGKLAPQNADDEKAEVFLDCIDAIRAGLVHSQRKSTVEVEAEPLFGAPANWVWRSLGSVLNITGGVTLGRKLGDRAMVSKPYLRVANVQRGYLALEQIKEISVPSDEVEKYRLHEHDLLITEGGDWDKVGRTAIWRGKIPDCLHQNHVFRARPLVSDFCTEWAELFLNSAFARQYFAGSAKQTTNLASINITQLRACPFPVPPLAEQHRIIAKVGELMSLFDQLYAHLIEARQKHSQLAAVLVEEAVA
ncbi:MAG: restriction endonuclease subunit S [Curvibacter lanceolatus]|uniref:restriction endonuclease subunit S n=1 Tax=Curvibacter lanceolatus TaxID=86182 RepID=UPI0023530F5B|nr:restriction endonuclease subunit S [Curvibacter lanceolatus]MBV5295125.1 restriction endonuclease subunit S [Curvibacter lanceolatus]